MQVKVTIEFRDDKKKDYYCTETPSVGSDWITLYYEDMAREMIPAETISRIEYCLLKTKKRK